METHIVQRAQEPQNKEELEHKVPREQIVNGRGEVLEHGEKSEHDPVGQPLSVVISSLAFNRLDGAIGRENETNKVTMNITLVTTGDNKSN